MNLELINHKNNLGKEDKLSKKEKVITKIIKKGISLLPSSTNLDLECKLQKIKDTDQTHITNIREVEEILTNKTKDIIQREFLKVETNIKDLIEKLKQKTLKDNEFKTNIYGEIFNFQSSVKKEINTYSEIDTNIISYIVDKVSILEKLSGIELDKKLYECVKNTNNI